MAEICVNFKVITKDIITWECRVSSNEPFIDFKNYPFLHDNSITIHDEHFSSERNDLTYETSENFTCIIDAKNNSDKFVEGLLKFIKKSRESHRASYTLEI